MADPFILNVLIIANEYTTQQGNHVLKYSPPDWLEGKITNAFSITFIDKRPPIFVACYAKVCMCAIVAL